MLDTLDAADVRTVVVSDAWLDFWGPQPGNPLIQAYLAGSFQEQAVFGVYRVLGRR